jgi:hypothetical protein
VVKTSLALPEAMAGHWRLPRLPAECGTLDRKALLQEEKVQEEKRSFWWLNKEKKAGYGGLNSALGAPP